MKYYLLYVFVVFIFFACQSNKNQYSKLKIIIDTDANNELDDQHALAYAFLNDEVFDVVGVTVNNTENGEGIQGHYNEAMRILKLFNLDSKIPLKKGATGSFSEINPFINQPNYDGHEAIDFIIQEALKMKNEKLVLVPIGKLTNVALAITKEPRIIEKIKVVWLGSNYPASGEYNLENDTTSVNPVIQSGVEFEMVTVRYNEESGTGAVKIFPEEVEKYLKGKGPKSAISITGRHGGEFSCFGDYAVNLFERSEMYGDPPARSLFDMAALAVLKNENWGNKVTIPAPTLDGIGWLENQGDENQIIIWEYFNRDAIVNDLFEMMDISMSKN